MSLRNYVRQIRPIQENYIAPVVNFQFTEAIMFLES